MTHECINRLLSRGLIDSSNQVLYTQSQIDYLTPTLLVVNIFR